MNSQDNYGRLLLNYGVPYLTICAVISQWAYWSTFGIRIMDVVDISTILLSFALNAIVALCILLLMTFPVFIESPEKRVQNEIFYIKKAWHYWLSLIMILSILACLAALPNLIFSWMLLVLIPQYLTGHIIHQTNFLKKEIEIYSHRKTIVEILILLPFLTLSTSKIQSLRLYHPKAPVNDRVFILKDTAEIQYKLIGQTTDYVFVLDMDNSNVRQIPISEITQLRFERREEWSFDLFSYLTPWHQLNSKVE